MGFKQDLRFEVHFYAPNFDDFCQNFLPSLYWVSSLIFRKSGHIIEEQLYFRSKNYACYSNRYINSFETANLLLEAENYNLICLLVLSLPLPRFHF